MLVAASGGLSPNTGFFILLPLFAAVVLGGIGNAYGALAGAMVIGLVAGVVDPCHSRPSGRSPSASSS